jgi:acetyl esterase/lipase
MADQLVPYGPEAVHAHPAADTGFIRNKIMDIAYADRSSFQRLDLYYPEAGKGPYPLILAVHGGAWMMCDKADIQILPMLRALDRGYAVASVNYRLSWEAKFPAQIRDIKAAIRFLRSTAEDLDLDPSRFAAWGGSAGAHLSTLAGLTGALDEADHAKLGLAPELVAALESFSDSSLDFGDVSAALQAVVAWYGPTDFLLMDDYLASNGLGPRDHGEPGSPESLLLGATISTVPELVRLANPETYVSPLAPPVFLQHGKADSTVPYQHSTVLAAKLQAAGGTNKVRLEILEDAIHGDGSFETPENVDKVLDFLDAVMFQARSRAW